MLSYEIAETQPVLNNINFLFAGNEFITIRWDDASNHY